MATAQLFFAVGIFSHWAEKAANDLSPPAYERHHASLRTADQEVANALFLQLLLINRLLFRVALLWHQVSVKVTIAQLGKLVLF